MPVGCPGSPEDVREAFNKNKVSTFEEGKIEPTSKGGNSSWKCRDDGIYCLEVLANPMIGIAFGRGDFLTHIQTKQAFDLVYTLDENEWNGSISLQLKVKDLMA